MSEKKVHPKKGIKDRDPAGTGSSLNARLAKLTPEKFKAYFDTYCKKDSRTWQVAYKAIGGVIEKAK